MNKDLKNICEGFYGKTKQEIYNIVDRTISLYDSFPNSQNHKDIESLKRLLNYICYDNNSPIGITDEEKTLFQEIKEKMKNV